MHNDDDRLREFLLALYTNDADFLPFSSIFAIIVVLHILLSFPTCLLSSLLL